MLLNGNITDEEFKLNLIFNIRIRTLDIDVSIRDEKNAIDFHPFDPIVLNNFPEMKPPNGAEIRNETRKPFTRLLTTFNLILSNIP